MPVNSVLVVGAGLMGSGIAQVCAQAGIRVMLHDMSSQALDSAKKNIAWSVGKFIEKGKLTENAETVLNRITLLDSLPSGLAPDLAIEAVFEKMDIKKSIFQTLDACCGPDTLIASNTSAIPITELAAVTSRPEKVLGLHFFSPVPMMMAVEVIKGMQTADDTFQAGKVFVEQVGKTPIMVHRDVAGFVINRINLPASMEAMRLVEEGVATVEDIDKGLKLASGRKMGIFETGDMVGLDVTYGALMAMYQETGDPGGIPPCCCGEKSRPDIWAGKPDRAGMITERHNAFKRNSEKMQLNEVVLVDIVRTAFGRAGEKGIFWNTRAEDLAIPLLKALINAIPVLEPSMIQDSIWGVTNQVKEQASTLGRMITMLADWGWEIPGCSIDRMCASGLTAIGFAATTIMSGMADCLIAGGVEHLGHVPMGFMRVHHPRAADVMGDESALVMGLTAENIHDRFPEFTREMADAYAAESQKKAEAAMAAGKFHSMIIPIDVELADGTRMAANTDQHPRPGTTYRKTGPTQSRRSKRTGG